MNGPGVNRPAADRPVTPAADLLALLGARGETLAVAESLTGGLVAAALTDVPGSSAVLRGGVVAYATDLKTSVLGVDADLLAAGGPVQGEVAAQMAGGVARVCGATWGLATTGVAGPGPADGHPAGTAYVAVSPPAQPGRSHPDARAVLVGAALHAAATGADRQAVRRHVVAAVLALALDTPG